MNASGRQCLDIAVRLGQWSNARQGRVGQQALTWSRMCLWRTIVQRRQLCSSSDGVVPPEWKSSVKLKPAALDLTYLSNKDNVKAVDQDIQNRKGVGDVRRLLELQKTLESEENPAKRIELEQEILSTASDIPNTSHPESPVGDEESARQIALVGNLREFDFQPRTMVELGESLGLLRTSNVTPATGYRTYYLKDSLARLEQALVKYTLRELKQRGFELVTVPDLLYPDIIESCGFKTSGERTQVYKLDPEEYGDVCLAGTSEMSLAGYHMNEIFDHTELPKKVAAVSRCYRAEVSAAEEGLYRVHQFTKVEMFGVTGSESGDEADSLLWEIIDIEKVLFSQLGLYFRVLEMPTQELGAPAHRKFDIEAWMPGRQFWGEISSASNCTDYQSRRLHIQYRSRSGDLKHCSTVNGTACAIPRLIMAICENFQQKDGSVVLPDVLWEFMDGKKTLEKTDKSHNLTWIKYNNLKRIS